MSEPVTNAEVEDVLSSIRRLVSEEKRPLQPSKPEPPNDRLVLTPALRVAEDPSETPDDEALETTDAPQASGDHAYDDPYDDGAKEPSELVAEPSAGEPQSSLPETDDLEEDYAADPYNFDDEDDQDGESDTPLAVKTKILAEFDWGEDDDDEEAEWAEASTEAEPAWIEDDDDPAENYVKRDPAPVTPSSLVKTGPSKEEIAAADTKAATISAKIEALESALGGAEDEFEPEMGDEAFSSSEPPAMAWEDDLAEEPQDDDQPFHFKHSEAPAGTGASDKPQEPAIASAMPAADGADTDETVIAAAMTAEDISADNDQPFAFASDDQLIDEEALRDLVSDIVRAELQGALGERITRNVRKLVRREIHRALTTQELD